MTKKYNRMRNIYGGLSLVCTVGPLLYFVILAMLTATPTQKVAISAMALAGVIICLVNACMKVHPRCVFWLVLLAAYYALGNILEVLYIMAATCFLDEIWFTPAYKYANSKYSINKEIDKRHG